VNQVGESTHGKLSRSPYETVPEASNRFVRLILDEPCHCGIPGRGMLPDDERRHDSVRERLRIALPSDCCNSSGENLGSTEVDKVEGPDEPRCGIRP
jgi:hypothetical protein